MRSVVEGLREWNERRRARRLARIIWPPPGGPRNITSCPMVPITTNPGRR